MGLVALLICSAVFGTTESYQVLLAFRFLQGFFGANSTIAKGMIGDITSTADARAWGYAMYGAVFGMSGILGPALGYYVVNPAQSYPNYFDPKGSFGQHPYLLICMVAGICSVLALISTILFLQEHRKSGKSYIHIKDTGEPKLDSIPLQNLANNNRSSLIRERPAGSSREPVSIRQRSRSRSKDKYKNKTLIEIYHDSEEEDFMKKSTEKDNEIDSNGKKFDHEEQESFKFTSLNTIGPIVLYMIMAYINMAYVTALSMYFSGEVKDGGLGISANGVEGLFTAMAAMKLFSQLVFLKRY